MEARMPEVVVYLLEGRSLEQKRGLVKDITQAVVKNAGTTADQVTVSLVETPKTSKAKGGVPLQRNGRPLKHDPEKGSGFGKDNAQTKS
jgi:4-oxalocrotonate tautomerase